MTGGAVIAAVRHGGDRAGPLVRRRLVARGSWVAGETVTGPRTFEVRHPYDGEVVAEVCWAEPDQVERALAGLDRARPAAASLPVHVRADALLHVSRGLTRRAEEFAELVTAESGKPLRWSRVEVARAAATFRWAAEECRREGGEVVRLDTEPAADGRLGYVRRVPRGPVLAVTPFNFPLNLVAHKVAPALAVGAPVLVKPAPRTPLSALALGELLAEASAATDLPVGMWAVLTVPDERLAALVADPRLPVVSFTGSGPVGWSIRDAVPRKHTVLELGGNAAAVVCADYTDQADLEWAARRVATFGNYQAGQSCIAVQRVLVASGVYERFTRLLVEQVEALGTGDPYDEATEVGPLIDAAAVTRVTAWVDEAVAAGARVLTGGRAEGTGYRPTVLTEVAPGAKVVAEEVFGPVLVVSRYDEVTEDPFELVNAGRYGIQAGVFTRDVRTAFRAHRELEVGGVIIGDVPSYRADQLPYGGVKESGTGREGVRAAMTDLTVERVLVLTGLEL